MKQRCLIWSFIQTCALFGLLKGLARASYSLTSVAAKSPSLAFDEEISGEPSAPIEPVRLGTEVFHNMIGHKPH